MTERIQLLATLLAEHGLEYAFGVTGSGSSLSLITALEDRGVQYFPVAHEASAALMAGAVSKASGSVSVSISIKGPGLANMLPGIVSNHFENSPALSISEAYGRDVPPYRKHKRLDHSTLLSSVVKGVISLDAIEHKLTDLLHVGRQEVPGPVHLELCTQDSLAAFDDPASRDTQSIEEERRSEFFRHLEKSRRPILIVGSLALRESWGPHLDALQIPVFTTVAAKGVLDESSAHSAGVFTGAGKKLAPESTLFAHADLVVAIGLRNTEVLQPKPFGKPLVMFDQVGNGLAEGFEADVLHIDTNAELVVGILKELSRKLWGAEETQSLIDSMQRSLLDVEWLPATCFDILNELDYPHSLVLDTGSFCTIGEHLWQAGPDRYFMGSSNGRYMGTAIPSAIGLAICRPDQPVFCTVGDGGMRMYPAEIKLAVQERLPVCLILMTDGRYGSVACAPQSKPMSSRAVTVYRPSWWRSVEAMGCGSRVVESGEAFTAAVETWDRKSPLFIEASFDPELYANMTARLR